MVLHRLWYVEYSKADNLLYSLEKEKDRKIAKKKKKKCKGETLIECNLSVVPFGYQVSEFRGDDDSGEK
jgi:hypothetical protein